MTGSGALSVGWGLGICSAIPLPGAAAMPAAWPVSISIEVGAVPAWRERRRWGPYRVGEVARFAVAMPRLARFTCLDTNRIIVEPVKGAAEEGIAAMLIATVLPALLWARGEVLLHGAAATPRERTRAAVVVGRSGSGKSTLLARAVGRGAFAIADDSVCLRIRNGEVIASGLPGGWWRRHGAEEATRDFQPIAAARQVIEHPVRRLVALEPISARRTAVRGVEALSVLLRHRHRSRIAWLLGTEPGFVRPLADLSRLLQVVTFRDGCLR